MEYTAFTLDDISRACNADPDQVRRWMRKKGVMLHKDVPRKHALLFLQTYTAVCGKPKPEELSLEQRILAKRILRGSDSSCFVTAHKPVKPNR